VCSPAGELHKKECKFWVSLSLISTEEDRCLYLALRQLFTRDMDEWDEDMFCISMLNPSSIDTWHKCKRFFTPYERLLLQLPKMPGDNVTLPREEPREDDIKECLQVLEKHFDRGLSWFFDQYYTTWLCGFRSRFRRAVRSVNDVVLDENCLNDVPDVFQVSTAVYPYWTKFTPSCDPDVVEINCAEYLVVRARRPLKKGKAITRSSGASFLNRLVGERRAIIRERFRCDCRPCKEDWPKEEVLRAQAEKGEFKVNCPKCGSSLGLHRKAFGKHVDEEAVCGKNGCTQKRVDIKNRISSLIERLKACKNRRNFCQPVEDEEEETEELEEAFKMVTEARLLMEQPCIHIVECERYADVSFLRMGNARHDSQKESRDSSASKLFVSPNDLVHCKF
jgi:hypothetical protein